MACWTEGATLLLVLLGLLDLHPATGWSSRHRSLRRQTRGHHEGRAHQNITLAVILPQSNTDYPWAWPRIGPALERAVRTINADPTLLPDHHLTYAFKNSEDKNSICSESVAPLMAVDLKLAYDPWAFIGPGCSYTSSPVGLFTTHWDVPMVTAGAPAVAFYGGGYPSITNTGPTHKKLGKFALRICEHFGWREHVMLMFSDNKVDDRPCYFAVEGLYTELKSNNITLVDRVFEESNTINYSQILSDIQNDSRGEWNMSISSMCCLFWLLVACFKKIWAELTEIVRRFCSIAPIENWSRCFYRFLVSEAWPLSLLRAQASPQQSRRSTGGTNNTNNDYWAAPGLCCYARLKCCAALKKVNTPVYLTEEKRGCGGRQRVGTAGKTTQTAALSLLLAVADGNAAKVSRQTWAVDVSLCTQLLCIVLLFNHSCLLIVQHHAAASVALSRFELSSYQLWLLGRLLHTRFFGESVYACRVQVAGPKHWSVSRSLNKISCALCINLWLMSLESRFSLFLKVAKWNGLIVWDERFPDLCTLLLITAAGSRLERKKALTSFLWLKWSKSFCQW